MRGPGRILIPLLVVLLIAGLAGCGSGEDSTNEAGSTETTSTAASGDQGSAEPGPETVDKPPKLPDGWKTSVNDAGGLSTVSGPGSAEP